LASARRWRKRFFLRIAARAAFHPEDLEQNEKKMHELAAGLEERSASFSQARGAEAVTRIHQDLQVGTREEKADEPMVSFSTTGKFHRFLPRSHIHPPRHSSVQTHQRSRQLIGRARKGMRNPSASRLRAFYTKKNWTNIGPHGRRPSGALTGNSARSSIFSCIQEAAAGLIFWHPKGGFDRTGAENGCATTAAPRLRPCVHPAQYCFRSLEIRAREF